MATVTVSFRFDLHISTEQRENGWAATTDPFAITTYADTAKGAEDRAGEATDMFLATLTDSPPSLEGFKRLAVYLTRRGVKHVVQTDPPVPATTSRRELVLEAVGA